MRTFCGAILAYALMGQPSGAQQPPRPVITEIRSPDRLASEVRQRIEDALPRKAYVKPKKPRRLLVMDLQVNYGGHRSIPHANLAVDLMGKKLGVWEAVFSNEMSNLKWDKIRQFDAIYLNNTVGPLFNDPEVRESLLRFIREGGGLAGNHGSTHCSMDWPEFTELIGARNGPHRDAGEKVTIKLDMLLQHFLAGFQFALEDLEADTTPSAKLGG